MDGGKRNRIIIVATIAATVLLVAAGIASALLNPIPSSTGDPTRLVAASKSKERSAAAGRSGHASTRASALKLCSDIAPKAAKAYVTDSENRESELRKYFTTDAQGLNIPVSRIEPQPAADFAGGLNTASGDTAVCSVHTGLESPWMLTWQWTDDDGWLCTAIAGPLDGAYKVLGDKPTEEQ